MALSARIYAASVMPLTDTELFKAAYGKVSQLRREKTDRLRHDKDKRLSLGAELLLGYALTQIGMVPLPEVFEIGDHGKPYIPDSEVEFSLSHSGEWVLCAVADTDIGCDIEMISDVDLKLAERFASAERMDILAQPTLCEQRELFYRYWTLKESFMKTTGLGLRLPLDSFEIVRGDTVSVRQSVDDRRCCFKEYDSITGYRCAVCAADAVLPDKLMITDIASIIKTDFKST